MLAIWQAAPLAPAHTCTSGSTAATWGASVAHTTGQLTYRLGKADTLPYTERVGDPGPQHPLDYFTSGSEVATLEDVHSSLGHRRPLVSPQ